MSVRFKLSCIILLAIVTYYKYTFHNIYSFEKFFGLRDFIHFINYIRRKRKVGITPQLVLHSLERNFNGSQGFEKICSTFLSKVHDCTVYYIFKINLHICYIYRWKTNWKI